MDSVVSPRSKLPDVGTTIFTVIGQLAAQHQALDLCQGAPNFPCDPRLVEAAAHAMRSGHNQYSPMAGVGPLREAIASKCLRLTGARYQVEDEVTVVGSASQGLCAAIGALVHPGDEVIYFEPAFDSYAPLVRLQGATPVAVKLAPGDFRVDWDQVAAALTARTRMIIVNTPHNPTATVSCPGSGTPGRNYPRTPRSWCCRMKYMNTWFLMVTCTRAWHVVLSSPRAASSCPPSESPST